MAKYIKAGHYYRFKGCFYEKTLVIRAGNVVHHDSGGKHLVISWCTRLGHNTCVILSGDELKRNRWVELTPEEQMIHTLQKED